MYPELKDKIVVITGAASGIGRAACRAFACEGAQVIACDIDVEGLRETVSIVRDSGGNIADAVADIADGNDLDRLFRWIDETYGRLDIAINNAGIGPSGKSLIDMDEADFDRRIAVNLKGLWLCLRRELGMMLPAGQGSIINVASVMGLRAIPNASEYIASKHGMIGLTKSAALEYSGHGIRINAICPATIATAMTDDRLNDANVHAQLVKLHPIGRIGVAEDVTGPLLWLASSAAAFVSGVAIPIDGAWMTR